MCIWPPVFLSDSLALAPLSLLPPIHSPPSFVLVEDLVTSPTEVSTKSILVTSSFDLIAQLSTLLRKTPPGIARLPSVKSALSASACLVRGDHGSFLRLWSETSSPIAQQLMAEAVEASRREMMQALAASYRLLPVTAVLRMLHLAEGDQAALLAVIKGAADRGSRGSSQALEALRSSAFACESSGSCPAVVSLTFKT